MQYVACGFNMWHAELMPQYPIKQTNFIHASICDMPYLCLNIWQADGLIDSLALKMSQHARGYTLIKRNMCLHVKMTSASTMTQIYIEITRVYQRLPTTPFSLVLRKEYFWLSSERLSRSKLHTLHLIEGGEGSLYSCTSCIDLSGSSEKISEVRTSTSILHLSALKIVPYIFEGCTVTLELPYQWLQACVGPVLPGRLRTDRFLPPPAATAATLS